MMMYARANKPIAFYFDKNKFLESDFRVVCVAHLASRIDAYVYAGSNSAKKYTFSYCSLQNSAKKYFLALLLRTLHMNTKIAYFANYEACLKEVPCYHGY